MGYNHHWNENPSGDQEQAAQDRKTWRTEVECITGGYHEDPFMGGGPVVGNPYDGDPMGEERSMVTYAAGSSMTSNKTGAARRKSPA